MGWIGWIAVSGLTLLSLIELLFIIRVTNGFRRFKLQTEGDLRRVNERVGELMEEKSVRTGGLRGAWRREEERSKGLST
jgi:hypothetical protein